MSKIVKRRYAKVAIATVLTAIVTASVWFASPTKAFDVTFPTLPTSGTIGSPYSFTTEITLYSSELMPIQAVNLYVYKSDARATYEATAINLPLGAGSKSYADAQTGGGSISTVASATNWTYGFGYGYALWQGEGYYFFPPGGYGYGYGYGTGSKSITYNIAWTPPSSWPSGQYKAEVKVTAGSSTFTEASTAFTLSTAGGLVGGGGGGAGLAGITPVLGSITENGRFTEDVIAKSGDRKVELYIPEDTIGKNRYDSLLTSISIKPMAEPPAPPQQTNIIGLVYDIGPNGAHFEPPIDLTIKYDASLLPEGVAENNLVVAVFDRSTSQWIVLESTSDTENGVITAKVSHFSAFTILSGTRPASFEIADLYILPDKIGLGASINVSVLITNTGDLTGSYEVNLEIDGVLTQTKQVTLNGGDSETISFYLIPDLAGKRSININGVTGLIQVEEPEAGAAFATSGLSISPREVNTGEDVTIRVTVTNTGDLAGNYKATLKVDNEVTATREINLDAKMSRQITFTTSKNVVGTYDVSIDDLSGFFTVNPPPAPPAVPPVVQPAQPAVPPVTPVAPSTTPTPINYWLIGVVIAAGIIVGIAIALVMRLKGY